MDIDFSWDDDIDWNLAERYLAEVQDSVARRAAEFMADRMRLYCPVDTGFLQNTIITSHLGNGVWEAAALAEYAAPVAFGYFQNGVYHPPNPFATNALADTAQAFPELVARAATDAQGLVSVSFTS